MKKVAVIKLGSRIAFGGTSGGSGEALAIIDMLVRGGADVTAFTKVLNKDKQIPNIKIMQIKDYVDTINTDNYDSLVVLNGNVNYFGGAEDYEQTINYKAMNNFSKSGGSVSYILCDPNLILRQVWPSVSGKEWASNYKQEEIELNNIKLNYICQPSLTGKVKEDIEKKSKLKINSIVHHPFEKFPLLNEKVFNVPLSEKTYDLLYGGTFRGGKRQDDMIKFYFGQNATMFGNIKESNFALKKVNAQNFEMSDMPKLEKPVKYDEFNAKMSTAKATVIIGDKYYKEIDDLAQRIYESIQAGVITFIDEDYDRNKRVFSNPKLRDLLYVKDGEDVKQKMDIINNLTNEQYQAIIDMQRSDTLLDKTYSTQFVDLL